MGKAFTDIGLPGTDSESKKFDSSLLAGHDAGLFLNSIQESLGMEHLATHEKQSSETPGCKEGVKVKAAGEEGVKVKAVGAEGVKVAPELGVSSEEEKGRVLRKSTRLQHRSREEREGEGRKEDAQGNMTEVSVCLEGGGGGGSGREGGTSWLLWEEHCINFLVVLASGEERR